MGRILNKNKTKNKAVHSPYVLDLKGEIESRKQAVEFAQKDWREKIMHAVSEKFSRVKNILKRKSKKSDYDIDYSSSDRDKHGSISGIEAPPPELLEKSNILAVDDNNKKTKGGYEELVEIMQCHDDIVGADNFARKSLIAVSKQSQPLKSDFSAEKNKKNETPEVLENNKPEIELENSVPIIIEEENIIKEKDSSINDVEETEDVKPSRYWSAHPITIFKLKTSGVNLLLYLFFVGILILPIRGFTYVQELEQKKDKVIEHALNAADYLQEAKEVDLMSDIETLGRGLGEAQMEFVLAQKEIGEISSTTQTIIKILPGVGGSFKAGENVLVLGDILTEAGQNFVKVVKVLQNKEASAQSPTAKLEIIKNNLILALTQLQKGDLVAAEIDINDIPDEYRKEIVKIQKYLPEITERLKSIVNYVKILQEILGDKEIKRYLLVFQNNNEIRPSGGFIGSFALIDFNQGNVENLEIPAGGSYDLEGGERKKFVAPEPLQLINPYWHFWDSNWFFDFPTSAKKIIDFYSNSGGPTVDGVIAINATLMQELVGVVGSVSVEGYDYEINNENFVQILQEEGSSNKFKKEPKRFLSLLGPKLLERLIDNPQDWLKMLPILSKGLQQKDVQAYFSAYNLQREIMNLGWSGRILETTKDYLAVVHTNLGGGKTDQVIKNEIWHNAEILENGEVEDTLIITRSHSGQKGDPFVGIANNDYMRIYVPLGSELIAAYGFSKMPADAFETPEFGYEKDELIDEIESQTEIDSISGTRIFTESNKTVFGNWLHLEPGETKSVYLKYRLPFVVAKDRPAKEIYTLWEQVSLLFNPKLQPQKLSLSNQVDYYSLLVQKQSGLNNTKFISNVKFAPSYQVSWYYPQNWQLKDGSYQLTTVLDKDMMEVLVVE